MRLTSRARPGPWTNGYVFDSLHKERPHPCPDVPGFASILPAILTRLLSQAVL